MNISKTISKKSLVIGVAALAILIAAAGFAIFGKLSQSNTNSAYIGSIEMIKMTTSRGVIEIELYAEQAPITVQNFVEYVESDFFDETIFHRVIPSFVIQGGGFTPAMEEKTTREPITNEANNDLKNTRGTLSMARTNDPDSATSQFFINLADNAFLDLTESNAGYAVFGKVVAGMEVVDAIAQVKTGTVKGHADVPLESVVVESAEAITE